MGAVHGMLEGMPRFTLGELLVSTTLIAFGSGMVAVIIREGEYVTNVLGYEALGFLYVAWMAGGSLIGAGLCMPFRRPWLGAAIGAIIQVAWPVIMVAMWGL